MRTLEQLASEMPADIGFLLFDIDDTLTTDGRLAASAYAALSALRHAGVKLIPITGRPAGWCDHIARLWPVDAVVGENGALYFCYDHGQKKMQRRFICDEATRMAQRAQLASIAAEILREVPGTALASDQAYREADIAIDFCEDVPRLSDTAITRIHHMMCERGLNAKVSSIHVNGWFGEYDKLSTTRLLFREWFAADLDEINARCVFVGDSPNDAPMFGFFRYAVGVANVRDFASLDAWPSYLTGARSGEGFVQLAQVLLARLGAATPPLV